MLMRHRRALAFVAVLAVLPTSNLRAQTPKSTSQPTPGAISKADCERALGILEAISTGIQNLYYDPKMNGVDWNAVIVRARAKIAESNSLNEALTQIAVAVSSL